jgi:hypothetical protein
MRDDYGTIDEPIVYPGHPVTMAVILLHVYRGRLHEAWAMSPHGPWFACENEVNVPSAGGALGDGCDLIRYVLSGEASIDDVIAWGDRMWIGAGGHKEQEAPGQAQADRLKPKLREMLAAIMPAETTT